MESDNTYHLTGNCLLCNKSLRANKKHNKYYESGWEPSLHKKCVKAYNLIKSINASF